MSVFHTAPSRSPRRPARPDNLVASPHTDQGASKLWSLLFFLMRCCCCMYFHVFAHEFLFPPAPSSSLTEGWCCGEVRRSRQVPAASGVGVFYTFYRITLSLERDGRRVRKCIYVQREVQETEDRRNLSKELERGQRTAHAVRRRSLLDSAGQRTYSES